jgi:subfamily B ATP-binding cassette protein MsbA
MIASTWTRPFRFLQPHSGRLIVATVALFISAGLGLVFPLVITRLLESVAQHKGFSAFGWLASLLAGVFLGQAVFSFIQSYLFAAVGEHIVFDLRTRLYEQMQSLSLDFFAKHRSGELVSRLTNDIAQTRSMLTTNLASSLNNLAMVVGAVVIILVIDLRFTLFIFSLFAVMALVGKVFGGLIHKSSTAIQDEVARCTVIAEEALQGIRVVKAFGREGYEIRRFGSAMRATLGRSLRQALYQSSFTSLMVLLGFCSIGASMFYGAHEVIAGRLSLAILTGFLVYGVMMTGSLAALAGLFGQLRTAMGSVHRVFQILDLKPSVTDPAEAAVLPGLRGSISFENVTFGYQENVRVLHGISLRIRAGEVLGLVGPSGAGKSTLFNLLLRFYDPTSGKIRIDGTDVRTVTQSSLRSQMAIVQQDTILFGGTIRDNILYGRLDATEADVIAAAKHANAHDFIMELPLQYQTMVGDRGSALSGGQRQRIAIARAILRDPRVLLLDEATNSLDSESEALVQEALDRVMQRRTTIIIAHRLSTIKSADRIAVLNRGRIVELGSHDELMKLNGIYARSYLTQFRDSTETCLGSEFDEQPEPQPLQS